MKIKSLILGLSYFIVSVMSENDCEAFKNFFSKQGYSLDCCGNSIYVLCDDNNNIKSITLDSEIMNNFYKPISLDNFPIFPELQHLTITNAGDSTADPINGVFPMHLFDLPKLEILEIMSFNIRNITGTVNTNNNIKTINLCDNKIENFPYQFKSLPKLSHLDMSLNKLSGSLSNEIKEFHSLKYLNVDTNDLEGELIIPDSLEYITAVENKFTTFSASNSLENLQHIEVLDNLFDDNIFRSLMKSKKLKTLTLGINRNIKTIPDDIYQLNSLENLDLSNTSISLLPNNFFALSNLNYLNLAYNENLKNSVVVTFGQPINVCDFTDTDLMCYQPETCSFVFGYNDYRHCYDYEINQRHIFDENVTNYFKEQQKPDNHLIKYLIIIGISCLILIFIGCIGFYINKLIKRKLDDKIKKELELEDEVEDDNANNVRVTFTNMDGNDNSINPLIKKNSSKIYSPHNGIGRTNSVDPTVFTNIDTNIATVQSNIFGLI